MRYYFTRTTRISKCNKRTRTEIWLSSAALLGALKVLALLAVPPVGRKEVGAEEEDARLFTGGCVPVDALPPVRGSGVPHAWQNAPISHRVAQLGQSIDHTITPNKRSQQTRCIRCVVEERHRHSCCAQVGYVGWVFGLANIFGGVLCAQGCTSLAKLRSSFFCKHVSMEEVTEVFVNAPEDLLKCPICFDLLKDPVICPGCAHTFCALCFSRSVKLKASCPTCRTPIDTHANGVNKNRLVAEMLDSLLVHCRWGLKHKDSADNETSNNNNNRGSAASDGFWVVDPHGCPATFKRSFRQAHEKDCPHAILSCSHAQRGESTLHTRARTITRRERNTRTLARTAYLYGLYF